MVGGDWGRGWGGEGHPRGGRREPSLQRLVHLVLDGTLGTGEPVCPSIKVAASESVLRQKKWERVETVCSV